ncbi:Ig-like domain-containing protein [Gemmatimonadota bacterium Y43]|uniref:Ig-like domain-containing protein n=1 Tax=Gaopeijia maritima TaxID=3119007 RepID=UPI003280C84D
MSARRGTTSRTTRRLAAMAAALLLAACDGYFHAPAAEPAQVGVTFRQIAGGASGAFEAADNAAVEVRSGNTTLFADVVDLEPSSGGVVTEVRIDLPDGATTASVSVDLRQGSAALFTGSTTAALAPGEVTEATIPLEPVVASIDLDELDTFTVFGEARPLSGRALFASGHEVPGVTLDWQSLDPGVVRVEQTTQGWQAVAVADGSATLRGSGGGRVETLPVDVLAVVTDIVVLPDALSIAPGASAQLTAVLRDAGGSPVPGRTPEWSSGSPAVATVDATGLVTGVSPGRVAIEARSGTAAGSAAVTVSPPGPGVETLPATQITSTDAVLRAEIDPMGQTTSVRFDYGLASDLSDAAGTSLSSVPASSPPEIVTRGVSGLPPGERIYFRAVATNPAGTTEGEILSFETPPVPAAPSGLSAAFAGGVQLAWDDNSSDESYFEIERDVISESAGSPSLDEGGPARVFEALGTTGANVTEFYDASPGFGELHYRVRACNDDGCSPWSDPLIWLYGLPPAVQTLPATNLTSSSALLRASVQPNGAPTDIYWEVGYDPGFTTPPPDLYPASPAFAGEGVEVVFRSFTATGMQSGLRYARAVAENTWGTVYGNVISFLLPEGDEPR